MDEYREAHRLIDAHEAERQASMQEKTCICAYHAEDRGGGYTEVVPEYEPSCPVHSEHLFDPRTGMWVLRETEYAVRYPTGEISRCRDLEQAQSEHALFDRLEQSAPILSHETTPWVEHKEDPSV